MTNEQNIRAILTCIFSGCKDELIDLAVTRILETIEVETPWIPVSERLPDFEGSCLVTEETDNWNPITNEKYFVRVISIGFFIEGEFQSENKVVAWMPLPDPYRGGEL